MRARLLFVPVIGLSLIFFVLAATSQTDDEALAWALVGVMVPVLGIIGLHLLNMFRWRNMGKALGLLPMRGGAFPDLKGPYRGKRLVIMRRTDPTGMGPRLSTIVRLEGIQELRLPGMVANPTTVRGVLDPFIDGI